MKTNIGHDNVLLVFFSRNSFRPNLIFRGLHGLELTRLNFKIKRTGKGQMRRQID